MSDSLPTLQSSIAAACLSAAPQTRTVGKKASTNANAGHVGPNRQVREMRSPQKVNEVALYRTKIQGRPQPAELSGAPNADEEMNDGAVRFR
jgi:hypothetical protein